jgi:hypothetical protein
MGEIRCGIKIGVVLFGCGWEGDLDQCITLLDYFEHQGQKVYYRIYRCPRCGKPIKRELLSQISEK